MLLSLLVGCVGFGIYQEKQVANKNIHNTVTYAYWLDTYAETAPLIDKIIFTKTNDTLKVSYQGKHLDKNKSYQEIKEMNAFLADNTILLKKLYIAIKPILSEDTIIKNRLLAEYLLQTNEITPTQYTMIQQSHNVTHSLSIKADNKIELTFNKEYDSDKKIVIVSAKETKLLQILLTAIYSIN